MRGPIDFIVVGFEGNKFTGAILAELEKVVADGTIDVLDLALLSKDENGEVTRLEITNAGDDTIISFATSNGVTGDMIGDDDIDEVADLLENNTSAGILVIEHLWAKGLKKAIIDTGGVLVAEGRIHPDAAVELED